MVAYIDVTIMLRIVHLSCHFQKKHWGLLRMLFPAIAFFILMYPFLLSTPFRPKKNVILDINLEKCLSRFIPRIVLF